MEKTYINFIVYGDLFDPDSVSDAFGLTPTIIEKKGEYKSKAKMPNKHTVWEYKIDVPETWKIKENLDFLLGLLEPHTDYLTSLPDDMKTKISLVMYLQKTFNPGAHFSPEQLGKIAALHIHLTIDYIYSRGDTDSNVIDIK